MVLFCLFALWLIHRDGTCTYDGTCTSISNCLFVCLFVCLSSIHVKVGVNISTDLSFVHNFHKII